MSNAKPVDQREHRIKPKLVDIESYKKREKPKLTGRYLKNTKEWWNNFWDSDLATAIDIKSDLPVLERLASLMDERERIFKQAKKDFLLKIDSLMTNYATMLNSELNDVMKRSEENEKNILSLKKELEQLKK